MIHIILTICHNSHIIHIIHNNEVIINIIINNILHEVMIEWMIVVVVVEVVVREVVGIGRSTEIGTEVFIIETNNNTTTMSMVSS